MSDTNHIAANAAKIYAATAASYALLVLFIGVRMMDQESGHLPREFVVAFSLVLALVPAGVLLALSILIWCRRRWAMVAAVVISAWPWLLATALAGANPKFPWWQYPRVEHAIVSSIFAILTVVCLAAAAKAKVV